MIKKFIFSALFVLLTALGVSAEDAVKDYKLNVGQFDKLQVTDDVNVVYRCVPDSSGYVAFRADVDFADAFIFSVKKGTLRVQVTTEDVGKPGLPTVYCYSDFLTSVENSSNFTLRVETLAPMPTLKVKQVGNGKIEVENVKSTEVNVTLATGNGTVVISGQCQKAQFNMVGTGLIQADMLETPDVSCKILGSGSIGCWAKDNLDVRGVGSTKIYYKGDPLVKKVGGGKLFPLSAGEPAE